MRTRFQLNTSKNLMPSTVLNKPRITDPNISDIPLKMASSIKMNNAKRQFKGNQNLAFSKFDKKDESYQNVRGM